MTKEEILAMKAGKELSGLVAVEIMGRTCAQEVFLYCSTDISAAWQVVEKMRSMEDGDGNPLLCCLEIHSDHAIVWEVLWRYSELGNRNDGHKTHRTSCFDELPEAICKAALLAKQ